MNRIFGYAVAMALSFALAFGAVGIGLYQLDVARAEEALATFDFALADSIYARLEKSLEMGKRIPWIFGGVRADVQVRRNCIYYWRQDYAAILEDTAAAEEEEKALSPALRFIRANARYRAIAAERSREKAVQGLGRIIADYAKTIDADPTFTDAAFNYEFLLMLRDDVASGKRQIQLKQQGTQKSQTDRQESMHGEQGAEPKDRVQQKMKVLVPKEGDEDPDKRGKEPSRGSATKKSG